MCRRILLQLGSATVDGERHSWVGRFATGDVEMVKCWDFGRCFIVVLLSSVVEFVN